MKRDAVLARQYKLARALERATVPERPFGRGLRYIVHPQIAAACRPAMLTIASELRTKRHPVDEAVTHELLAFITDGRSPFFGRDVADAQRAAVRLQNLIVNGGTGQPTIHPRRPLLAPPLVQTLLAPQRAGT